MQLTVSPGLYSLSGNQYICFPTPSISIIRAINTYCVPVMYKALYWAPRFLIKDGKAQIHNKHKTVGEDRTQAPPTLISRLEETSKISCRLHTIMLFWDQVFIKQPLSIVDQEDEVVKQPFIWGLRDCYPGDTVSTKIKSILEIASRECKLLRGYLGKLFWKNHGWCWQS